VSEAGGMQPYGSLLILGKKIPETTEQFTLLTPILKMEAIYIFETSVILPLSTRRKHPRTESI
jgi:hypothetical protein